MILCLVQRGKLLHFREVEFQECLPVDSKVFKQQLFQLPAIRTGRELIQLIAERLFGCGQAIAVSVFDQRLDAVGKGLP